MITVPEAFIHDTVQREGDAGRHWLDDLPTRIEALCQMWNLRIDGDPIAGYLGLVIPTSRGDERCMLKVSWLNESTAHESLALNTWNGRGAVKLLRAAPEEGALLLERLDSNRSLEDLPIDEAVAIAGELLRQLAVPAPDLVPRLSAVATELVESIPRRSQELGCLAPQRLVDAACDVARQLGPRSQTLLANYDLHYGNVLAATRAPWLAIDPKVVAGDPEYAVGQLLWTRLEDMQAAGGLDRFVRMLVEHGALDYARTRAWSLVRTIDYWLWALSIGLTTDPVRCFVLAELLV